MATGARARTLTTGLEDPFDSLSPTPSTSSVRKRSRSRPESLDPKRKKKDQEDDPLITAITRSIEARKSSIIRAIEILVEEYYERLSESDFGIATDILADEIKASVFITLPVKDMRDRWLERQAGVFLI
jgi:hypothetical protein